MFFRHVTTRVSMWESDCHIISAKKGNVKNVLLGVLPQADCDAVKHW